MNNIKKDIKNILIRNFEVAPNEVIDKIIDEFIELIDNHAFTQEQNRRNEHHKVSMKWYKFHEKNLLTKKEHIKLSLLKGILANPNYKATEAMQIVDTIAQWFEYE